MNRQQTKLTRTHCLHSKCSTHAAHCSTGSELRCPDCLLYLFPLSWPCTVNDPDSCSLSGCLKFWVRLLWLQQRRKDETSSDATTKGQFRPKHRRSSPLLPPPAVWFGTLLDLERIALIFFRLPFYKSLASCVTMG